MCEYCLNAFKGIDDDWNTQSISENVFFNLAGDKFSIVNQIDERGCLRVVAVGFDERVLTNKKIRFCPMCGAELPDPTPTEAARARKG